MENEKIAEASQKQNLEELISAIKPHLPGGPKGDKQLLVYLFDNRIADRRPYGPASGWLQKIGELPNAFNEICDGLIISDERCDGIIIRDKHCEHIIPFSMIVRIDACKIRLDAGKTWKNIVTSRKTIYKHPEGWKVYETAVEKLAQEEANAEAIHKIYFEGNY